MIRLTINPQSEPEIHLFNKSTILIGSGSSEVDLTLSEKNLQTIHLKIVEQEGYYIVINLTNDPFVSLNGHPFGKKLLHTGDTLSIHHTNLLFENLGPSTYTSSTKKPETASSNSEEPLTSDENNLKLTSYVQPNKKEAVASFFDFHLPFETEIETLKEEELAASSIATILKEVETSVEQPQPIKKESESPVVPPIERKKVQHLKDDYLREFDDENQNSTTGASLFQKTSNPPPSLFHSGKWIILFLFSVLSIASIISSVIYLSVSDKTEAQEIKAAQGVADVAMALTHAQLNQLKPINQNWSDVDFLKNNLQAILPHSASYAAEIDSQGQFQCCPYSLRIYTSRDLSQFLLIAQPAPSFLQWLIPKSVIIVDSQLMELRTVKDVRTLNRLLANPDPLEGLNRREISTLVKQGELIRLSFLATESKNTDFAPPKNLGWLKNGVENFIYNAPRYYHMTQPFIQRAVALTTNRGTSLEVANLKQDVENFSKLPSLVLYAADGKHNSLLCKQGVATFAPSDKFLFGYLSFDSKGSICQHQILKEEEELKGASPVDEASKGKEEIAFQSPHFSPSEERKNTPDPVVNSEIDINHPIYIQLSTLSNRRENELRPLAKELSELLNQEIKAPQAHFHATFQDVANQYLLQDVKYQLHLKRTLKSLYTQYNHIPLEQFMEFVNALHLENLIQDDQNSFALIDENCHQNLETLFIHVDKSKTLTELNHIVDIACSWLNFDYICDHQALLRMQTTLRNKVLMRLERFLLSSKEAMTSEQLTIEEQNSLYQVLSHEKIIQAEERDYFLDEFKHFTTLFTPFPEQEAEETSLESLNENQDHS